MIHNRDFISTGGGMLGHAVNGVLYVGPHAVGSAPSLSGAVYFTRDKSGALITVPIGGVTETPVYSPLIPNTNQEKFSSSGDEEKNSSSAADDSQRLNS